MHDFIHLRVHSAYSLAQSMLRISDIISLSKKDNMKAVAICDNHNLFGSLEFSEYAAKNGIKPIISAKFNIQSPAINDKIDTICIYAKNDIGIQNLRYLMSDSYINRQDYRLEPFITYNDLIKHKDGLIILTAASSGTLGQLILDNQISEASAFLKDLNSHFDKHLYIELIRQDNRNDYLIEKQVLDFAYDLNIPIVATNPAFFPNKDLYDSYDILDCISKGQYVDAENRVKPSKEAYFKSTQEMNELFKDLPEALINSVIISERCSAMIHPKPPMLPRFTDNEEELFSKLAIEGLDKRLLIKQKNENIDPEEFIEIKKQYKERLDFEMQIIIQMQFSGYFLIVSDFIKWAKKNNIPVGPGRGSGAGSLVAWALEITNLDPIKFGLLFERFLNPERVSMPDFDIDFCQDRRDEVINYVREKYGDEKVAQIITFGKLQARAVIRDVGRVMQLPLSQVDRISKMVPHNPANPVNLSQAIELEPNLREAMSQDPQIAKLVNIALDLEGLYRHTSIHAAGIVIADKDLKDLAPLYRDASSDMQAIQYSMKYAEMAGLVKFDFLGLKTLTVIQYAVDLIKAQGIDLDIDNISLSDKKTFELLSSGEATGIFQFESRGMQDSLRKLKPDSLEDLIALGALYRPGPMDNIPIYIARKHKLEKPDYIHPSLETILKETFGVIIYQEQVMQIAQILSGYSLGAADLLRRAMGKKIKSEMDAQREIFVKGAVANNIDKGFASQVFDLVAKFAGYGFNKSHAAAYALISYHTAYLKANFTAEFLVASLNYDIDDTDKIRIFIQEAKKFKIKLLPPCINHSSSLFSIEFQGEEKCIRHGLTALKNIGKNIADLIVQERESSGKFKDIYDFINRVPSECLNRRVLENFAKAGVFDNLKLPRKEVFEKVEQIIKQGDSNHNINPDQYTLFTTSKTQTKPQIHFETKDEWSEMQKLVYENEVFGFYFSAHPLDIYGDLLKKYSLYSFRDICEHQKNNYATYNIAAIPIDLKMRVSNKGRFGYLSVSDQEDNFEISIFDSEMLDKNRNMFESGLPLIFTVDSRKDEHTIRLAAQKVDFLDKFLISKSRALIIKTSNMDMITNLKQFESDQGININIHLIDNNKNIIVALPKKYNFTAFDLNSFKNTYNDVNIDFSA